MSFCRKWAGKPCSWTWPSECYFGLESVETRIWELLQQNSNLQQTYDCLRAEYDVEPDRLRTDLLALVEQMLEAGLVRVA